MRKRTKERLRLAGDCTLLILWFLAVGRMEYLNQQEEAQFEERLENQAIPPITQLYRVDLTIEPNKAYATETTEEQLQEEEYLGELEILAQLVECEAGNQDLDGKRLVARTVLNRVESEDFPDTILEVIYQDQPTYQFTPVAEGKLENTEPSDESFEAVSDVAFDGWDESQGALYFEAPSESTWHSDHLHKLFIHGGHTFYK